MPDKLQNRGGQDRKRINVNEDYELRDWSKKFGVSKDKLKEAVQAVGDQADRVEKYLKGSERSGGTSDLGRGKSSI
ncbi:MAG: DUF3606 domain-containing protein [Burkholderiales bacterium]|jgi:hypothetical protein|nr:DUF3606 domain-containing protein [Burkholderiales bacterium]